MIFQQSARDGTKAQRCLFSLSDKHLYSTSCLNYIMELIGQSKANNAASMKCFANMIRWHISIRNTLFSLMPKLFKVQKWKQNRTICLPYLPQRRRLLGCLLDRVKIFMYVVTLFMVRAYPPSL